MSTLLSDLNQSNSWPRYHPTVPDSLAIAVELTKLDAGFLTPFDFEDPFNGDLRLQALPLAEARSPVWRARHPRGSQEFNDLVETIFTGI